MTGPSLLDQVGFALWLMFLISLVTVPAALMLPGRFKVRRRR